MRPDSAISLFVVIVIYKTSPMKSASFMSLQEAMRHVSERDVRLKILLFDNSPQENTSDGFPDSVEYMASPVNGGVSDACNRAIEIAESAEFKWLLTLDQDTHLPEDFLVRLCGVIAEIDSDPEIAAVVPQIVERGRILSPEIFFLNAFARYLPRGFKGISNWATFAFNSASTLRVSALREIGGYSPHFWLDYSDAYIYSQLNKRGKRVYVAGNIQVEHELAMMDANKRVSLDRYRTIVLAGCAFWDLELGTLAGLLHTVKLLFRFYRHWRRGDNPKMRAITMEILVRRITRSRKWRIAQWEAEMGYRPDRNSLKEKMDRPTTVPE